MKTLAPLVILSLISCAGSSAGTITAVASSSNVPVGQPLAIDIRVGGISDLFAFQFDIVFDPAILSATSVGEGNLFSGIGVAFSPGFIDNGTGTIAFIGDSLSGPGPGVSSDGILAQILFNAIGPGVSTVSLANVILLDSGLSDITATSEAASVAVTGVPEPATIVLVVPGFVALAALRRFRPSRS
jgi:general secretion pathway protein D